MQVYSKEFARAYNMRWTNFTNAAAPRILDFYERNAGEAALASPTGKRVLDICCGTGQLALCFLEQGYRVTGIDLSEGMLSMARLNTKTYLQKEQVRFLQADASEFTLDERFGLVVATFNSLNHLENTDALRRCFLRVFDVLVDGGFFILDLNTRLGLQQWNNISIEDDEEVTILSRGSYVETDRRAWIRVTGFVRNSSGTYTRFEETSFNTVFEMATVKALLLATGFRSVAFARDQDLASAMDEPEKERHVFIVVRK